MYLHESTVILIRSYFAAVKLVPSVQKTAEDSSSEKDSPEPQIKVKTLEEIRREKALKSMKSLGEVKREKTLQPVRTSTSK